ncbi:D-alanyl-D-alanine carboxypeptidase family protein [Turicibacter sp. TJ11]|uniref:M15 family metallopeptidase n=1 Tax=Turicibacter sp. TJ11 TaxID=2806443 RepID=UPI001F40241E|nr:M15 family metallopeptidase [Turicibacter sp. TJ11]
MKCMYKRKLVKLGIPLGVVGIILSMSLTQNMTTSALKQEETKEKEIYVAKADEVTNTVNDNQRDEEKTEQKQEQVEEKHPINYVSKPTFYQNVITVSNPDSMLVLVNKNYALNEDYEPSDLVLPNVLSTDYNQNQNIYLRKEAAIHLEQLFYAAQNEAGLTLLARSGYRSYQTQISLYDRYVSQNGTEKADTFSARAGHSEHQTGLAMDVTADSVNRQLVTDFGLTPEGIWLKENAHRFGYIIRYLEGREDETGYQYEPWHIRYVGVEAATEIYENNWILEQYLNKKS